MRESLAALLVGFPMVAQAAGACEGYVRCEGERCGCEMEKSGWARIGSCHDGHHWSYVLEKGAQRVVCMGINARDGAAESPCLPFFGEIDAFNATAQKASQRVSEYKKAKAASSVDGKLDMVMWEERRQNLTPANCWSIDGASPQQGEQK